MSDELNRLLAAKKDALSKAQAQVTELKSQIATLEQTITMLKPTAFETFLQGQVTAPAVLHTAGVSDPVLLHSEEPTHTPVEVAEAQKNNRGALRTALLQVMADGKARGIEQAVSGVNTLLITPTSHGSVAQTLRRLRDEGHLKSAGYGLYLKSESPADNAASNSNGKAFISQPVSGQAH